MVFLQEVNFSLSLIYTILYVWFCNHCQGTCKNGLDSTGISEPECAERYCVLLLTEQRGKEVLFPVV